jgi:hypothetical protein
MLGVYGTIAYRDKKVVGVFVRFRAASKKQNTITAKYLTVL